MKKTFEIIPAIIEKSPLTLAPFSLSRGDKIKVRNNESDEWTHAYFDKFDAKGKLYVLPNGRSPWTELNDANQQRHQLTAHDIDWGGDIFPSVAYNYFAIPDVHLPLTEMKYLENHKQYIDYMHDVIANGLILSKIFITQIAALKRGDRVQVRYNENDEWVSCYFDRFWSDGRIQVIPNGKSPWTETNSSYQQRHQLSDEYRQQYGDSFPYVTFNFYRLPQEITNSGDLRNAQAYLEHWS